MPRAIERVPQDGGRQKKLRVFHEGDRGGLRNRLRRAGRRQVTRVVVDTKDDDVVSGLVGGDKIGVGRIDPVSSRRNARRHTQAFRPGHSIEC